MGNVFHVTPGAPSLAAEPPEVELLDDVDSGLEYRSFERKGPEDHIQALREAIQFLKNRSID